MKLIKEILAAGCVALAVGLAGCKESGTRAPAAAAPLGSTTPESSPSEGAPHVASPTGRRGQPQDKLPTVKLWIGTNEVTAEIASSLKQISTGMMWRTNMAEMEGMLFVFPQPHQVSFYMRNTLLPLSCAYVDPDGIILELYDMTPLDETPIPSSSHRVQYVLEMNQGWFQRHNVKPGMTVASDQGALRETFVRR